MATRRRTNAQIVEDRLRKGGMAAGDIADVLKALEAGKHAAPKLPTVVTLFRDEKRPLVVPIATLTAIFGDAPRGFTLRPYRRKDGRLAASLLPGEAVTPEDEAPPVDAEWEKEMTATP